MYATPLLKEKEEELNEIKVDLFQNYPNPFYPETVISYSVSDFSQVELKVFDMLGRNIATLVNKEHKPGSYEVKFDGSNLDGGVYLYRIKAMPPSSEWKYSDDSVKIRKMILIK